MIDVSAKELEFFSNEAMEGSTLAERLAQGGLPAGEALRYAIEIGVALSKAHAKGAIHGKLSPASVLLTGSGARIVRPQDGIDLDTLPYRSPEQVRGEKPDWRSDIFSFGTLLYEMVSGRRAFTGEGAALDRAILERPPATLLGKSPIHAAMEGVIAGCIEKDPVRRRQRVQNAVIELKLAGRSLTRLADFQAAPKGADSKGYLTGETIDVQPERPQIFAPVPFPDEIQARPRKAVGARVSILLFGLFVLAVSALGAWGVWQYYHRPTPPVYKFLASPEGSTYRMPAVSPDGRYVAVQYAGADGRLMLWLRALDSMKPTPIPGTEGGFAPFWSPDSKYLAFFADGSMKKIPAGGGHAEKICDAETPYGGGTWNRLGNILFAAGQSSALYQVPSVGGKAQPLTRLNPARFENAHLWPQFLPDGKHFVFYALSGAVGASGVSVGSLDSSNSQFLLSSETNAVYSELQGAHSAGEGYLVYMQGRSLMAVGFNAEHLQVHGQPRMLPEDVGAVQSLSLAPVSISQNGTMVYQSVGAPTRQLAWVDRSGKALAPVTEPGEWGPPRISPDGSRAIVAKRPNGSKPADLWMVDTSGNATQFTSGPAHKGAPVWSPDGSRIAYFSGEAENDNAIVVSTADGRGKPEVLLKKSEPSYPTDWSRDGKFLLFGVLSPGTISDVWAMSLPDRHAGPVIDTVYREDYASLSPDGKWLAFQSDDTGGRARVYVQAFDGITHGTRRRYDDISTETGGGLPRWSADGKELFFMTNTGRLMSVNVHPSGDEFAHDAAKPLFQIRPVPKKWNLYDVSPDGQRFLVNMPMEWSGAAPITVMTNWTEKWKD